MKLTFLTIFIGLFLLATNCATAQESFDYSSEISFQITKGDIWPQIAAGDGVFLVPENDQKIYMVYLSLTNSSSEKQRVDFGDFYLVKGDYKYEVGMAMPIGLINRMYLNRRKKIRPQKTLRCKLAISFPEGEIPEYLEVNGELIPIDPNLFDVN